jgi:hypothetical protein
LSASSTAAVADCCSVASSSLRASLAISHSKPVADALWSAASFVLLRVFRAPDFRLGVFLDLALFFPERRFIAYPA